MVLIIVQRTVTRSVTEYLSVAPSLVVRAAVRVWRNASVVGWLAVARMMPRVTAVTVSRVASALVSRQLLRGVER